MRTITAFLLLPASLLWGQQKKGVDLKTIESLLVYSSEVGDSFLIQVALPSSFTNSGETYPVVYVLDANKSFGMATDIVDWLSFGGEIPEAVVVGISYQQDWWQKRSRDYTPTMDKTNPWGEWPLAGGADKFIRFIDVELNPTIEARYRIDKTNQTLVGLSFGGLFAQYVLLARTELFDNYLIVNPALVWNNNYVFGLTKDFITTHQNTKIRVFTAVGLLDEERIIEPWKRMNELMHSQPLANLSWIARAYENHTHFSLLPIAMTDGLKVLLDEN